MTRRNIRVEIPRDDVNKMLILSKATYAQHILMGSQSPLLTFDMPTFNLNIGKADTHLVKARLLHAQGEDQSELAWTLIGISKGQNIETEGTLYFQLGIIRKQLLVSYHGIEEQISEFGFNVVITGNRVRISLPRNKPEDMLYLAERVYAKHVALGIDSPLNAFNMAAFHTKTTEARGYHEEAKTFHEKAEGETQLAHKIIGVFKGQNIRTVGTLYYDLGRIRNHLLVIYQGNEEKLSLFGFNVVISISTPGDGTQQAPIIKGTVKPPANGILNIGMSGTNGKIVKIKPGDGPTIPLTLDSQAPAFISYVYLIAGIYTLQILNNLLDVLEFHCNNSYLTDLILPNDARNINTYVLQNNNLNTASVDYILMKINSFNTTGKLINLIGNAAPSAAGLAAKAALEARGWVVLVS